MTLQAMVVKMVRRAMRKKNTLRKNLWQDHTNALQVFLKKLKKVSSKRADPFSKCVYLDNAENLVRTASI